MSLSRRFLRDESGALVERVALISAVLALASVLGANLLSSMLQKGDLPTIALAYPDKRPGGSSTMPSLREPRGVGVDMTTTASIPGDRRGAAPLSPCEKARN
jgi:Flp pilus assembly pilin Flp